MKLNIGVLWLIFAIFLYATRNSKFGREAPEKSDLYFCMAIVCSAIWLSAV